MQPCEEDGCGQSEVGDAVAQGVGDAFGEAVETQPAEVVGDAALGHGARFETEQWGEESSQVAVGEPVG